MPYRHLVEVRPEDIDELGHAGNLVYLRWVLEAALAHSTAVGLDQADRDVPPTAVTNCEAAGYSTPKPLSPELTVIATPGWLKCTSELVWPLDSPPP